MTKTSDVELATVLPGAKGFKENNVNDTYRGQVLRQNGSVSNVVLKDVMAKELANELISFVLARDIGLPVPDALLAVADSRDLVASKGPTTRDGRQLVLASVDINVPNIAFRYNTDVAGQARLLGAIVGWPPLGRLYGFDAWIANIDRHAGNLLFGAGAEAWLIDHGWAFTGPSWLPTGLDPMAAYRHRLKEWLTPCLTQNGREMRVQQAGMLESELDQIDVDAAISASRANFLLDDQEVEALRAFLKHRTKQVTRLASIALDIPALI